MSTAELIWTARSAPLPSLGDGEVRPFRLAVAEAELDDLRLRLARTRWPDEPEGTGWSRGVPLAVLKEVAEHWRTRYDWRAQEARLNQLPQFLTSVEGQPVHFIHVRSPVPTARPLVVTHGWPGSVLEYTDLVGPLTRPQEHGGEARDAFHLVIPSIPGFGFSGPTSATGFTDQRIAALWARLMGQLGYQRYAAHGGDLGAKVSRALGVLAPTQVMGIHVTDIFATLPREEADLSVPAERESVEAAERYQRDLSGYGYLQSTRPQTLAYALTDSPAGQLAWILEKFHDWTDPTGQERQDGWPVDRDRILTNVMLYWLPGTAGSSAHRYADGASTWWEKEPPSTVPTAVAVLPRNIALPVRRIAERNNNIVQWTRLERGGHFAALEQPALLLADLRRFFRGLPAAS
jgi:pimeloyl-ACP methyl ester carboxylesterase